MKSVIVSILTVIVFTSLIACGNADEQSVEISTHDAFFANLSTLCDAHLMGGSTYPENEDHPLVGTELRNHVSHCDDRMIRIELIRDGDYWHGAWVIEKRDEGLHLFHDHLGDVRTLADLQASGDAHGYGGYATDHGTAFRQYFAADDVTAEMIPEASTNVWMMDMDLENGVFVYNLERHAMPRFRAVMQVQ
ncbi:MAG: hypothetical protein JJU41_00865 [Bacteroidetes bacterium]|nr:hypothetical protein [Bacteroidota bacterium]MCH8523033.1 hypothetical protein [Balneolales bacterium]